VWAHVDAGIVRAAARAGLAALARSGCTTASDHHYVFPRGAGDLLEVEIEAAREIGLRFHPCRGSMDLGRSDGGLPPDEITEDRDEILAACEEAIDRFHDPAPEAMVRIAIAPCSPFSVTQDLMREAAELARRRNVRLHTHMAETEDEERFCLELFGVRPVEYLERVGWLGDDVWLAHCVHLNEHEVRRFGETGTGVAHCPSSNARLGAGIAPVPALIGNGAPVGLGVDGAASNEAGELGGELRQALLVARLAGHGPRALTVREALELGTIHGARCLGREAEIGSLEPGKLADVALWRLDGVDRAGIADPVAALVLGARPLVDTLLVGGRVVVARGELRTADEATLARELAAESRRLGERAGVLA
jgi:cytosine/adenosine deaminase-related metal-dependent hydrolase